MTAPHFDGYELVTVLDAPHSLKALLYKRVPRPDPWAIDDDDPGLKPWLQDELPAGLETPRETVLSRQLPADVRERLAHLTPEARSALGFPDEAAPF